MTKHTSQFVLAAGLILAGFAPRAQASAIQSLDPTTMSAATFNSMYQSMGTAPAMSSAFDFAGAPSSGVVESQVFQGTGAAAGTYAYAYQIDVAPGTVDSMKNPAHVDSASFYFPGTPAGSGSSYAYLVTDGQVGNLSTPNPSGAQALVPSELSWQSGVLRAKFENAATGASALSAGNNSATFVVISTAPPGQQFVNLQSADPQTTVNGSFTSVYVPTGGTILPIPAPEPTTIMAWAGMLGGLALVRRVRKSRVVA